MSKSSDQPRTPAEKQRAAEWLYMVATNRAVRDELLKNAVRDALRAHKAAGNPVVYYEDGKIVIVPASEIRV